MIRQLDEQQLKTMIRSDMVSADPVVRELEPLAVGMRTMCLLLSVSENTLKKLISEGLPVVKLDGKNLFPIDLARQYLESRATKGASE